MNPPDFYDLKVVIVNWRRPADTIECINSLIESQLPISQIIVVDNGSNDDSVTLITRQFPGINIYRLPENQGFAGGYNYGITEALKMNVSKIMVLNNDTVVDQTAIPWLLNSKWDVSVPKIYDFNQPGKIWSAGAQWRSFPPMVIMRGYQKMDSERYDREMELKFATACALMINREVFEKVGGFDVNYKNYFEDYDFIYRVREAGFHVGYIPNSHVWHKVAQSMGSESPERSRYMGRNSTLFYRQGERFPAWMFYCFLGWVSLRELIKLKFRQIHGFWLGVLDGLRWLDHGTRAM